MKKSLIALAVAGVAAAPLTVMAGGHSVAVSGYAGVEYRTGDTGLDAPDDTGTDIDGEDAGLPHVCANPIRAHHAGGCHVRRAGGGVDASRWRPTRVDEPAGDFTAADQREFQIRRSFAYTGISLDETRVLGWLYIYPTARGGHDRLFGGASSR